MKWFDIYMRRKAARSDFPIDPHCEDAIEDLLQTLTETPVKPVRGRMRFATVAWILGLIVLIGIPVTAGGAYMQKRLQALTGEQQTEYIQTAQSHTPDTEGIRYSRDLTENETARYTALKTDYEENGQFPEGELQILQTDDDKTDQTLYFINATRTLHLPDSELTDEELLEIIDFYHKEEYAVAESEESKQAKEEQQAYAEKTPGQAAISEDAAYKYAYQYGAAFVDTDILQECKTELSYEELPEDDGDGTYYISWSANNGTVYQVMVDSYTGAFLGYELTMDQMDFHRQPAAVDTEAFEKNGAGIVALYQKIRDTSKLPVSLSYSYLTDGDTTITHGNVVYYAELEDGSAYRFVYNVKQDVIWNVTLYTNYRQEQEDIKAGIRETDENRITNSISLQTLPLEE